MACHEFLKSLHGFLIVDSLPLDKFLNYEYELKNSIIVNHKTIECKETNDKGPQLRHSRYRAPMHVLKRRLS